VTNGLKVFLAGAMGLLQAILFVHLWL